MPDPVTAITGGMGIIGSLIASDAQGDAAQTQANSANYATQLQYKAYQQQRKDLAPWRKAGQTALNALIGTPATPERTVQGAPIYGNALGGAPGETVVSLFGNEQVYNPEQTIIGYQPSTTIPAKAGTEGLLQKGPGEFEESPSYQFALEQGQQGIQRAASATGRLGSGAYLKDATKYAKGLASEEYQNFLNRYYQSLNPYFSLAGLGQIGATGSAAAAGQYGQAAGQNALYAGNATAAGQLGQGNTWANTMNWGGQQMGNYLAQNQLQNQSYGGIYSPSYGYLNPNQVNSMTWL